MRPTQNPEPHPERSRLSVGLISAAGVIAATGWLTTSSPAGSTSAVIAGGHGGVVQAVASDSTSEQQETSPAHHPKPALPTLPRLDSLPSASIQLPWDPERDRRLLNAPKQGPPAQR